MASLAPLRIFGGSPMTLRKGATATLGPAGVEMLHRYRGADLVHDGTPTIRVRTESSRCMTLPQRRRNNACSRHLPTKRSAGHRIS
jgi:hypothetical protein